MLVLGLLGLAWPGAARAVTTVTNSGHLIRIWQTEDGLPQNTVLAITQTRDGFLWVGTLAGLARFDGLHFQTFDGANTPSLRDERIASLYEDSHGTLWIGHESGDVTCYRDGHFEAFSKGAHPGESVYAITEDEGGTVWLFRQNGVLERAGQPGPEKTSSADNGSKVLSLARNGSGRVWRSVEGQAAELQAGTLHPLDFGPAGYSGYVRGVAAANDGGWWVVRDQRIRKWRDGHWTEDRGVWGNSDIRTMRELRNGTLAVGTMENGFHLLYPDGRRLTFDYNHGQIQNWVRLLYEDREGNLWVAAGSGGLAMVRPTTFDVLNSPDNWQGRTVLSVAPGKDGGLWIGTEGAGVYHYHEGNWTHYGEAEGFSNLFIWSLAVNTSGQVWAGTWNGNVYRLEKDRFVRATELDPTGSPVMALHFDAGDHSLWAGTRNGLLRWWDGQKFWYLRDPAGKPPAIVYAMVRDARDQMWLALADAGVGRLSAGETKLFAREDAGSADSAQCLLADGDTLWIGTQNGGLSRLQDGRFASISVKQGLASRVICHIEDDGQGYLWLSTHHGIVRVAKEELNRCADGAIATVASQTFDKDDGLPTLEYSGGLQAAGCQTGDGRIWFTSNKGLVSVNPGSLPFNSLAPPVVVESMWVDGRVLGSSGAVRLEPRLRPAHERIEFRFTALSLAAPSKVLFKYRLEGLDQGWIEAGDKRTAFYSHLPPGGYRFQVIACNNDGVWNTVGDSLPFTVAPFYWQTWWYRSSVVLLAVASVALSVRTVTRRRMQLRLDALERERGIERERARIAQDIHDDIGSSLTRITMLSQSVQAQMGQPARAAVLERIHDTALEVTHTLDEIVWAVNPRHDTLDSLVNYISRLAQETLADAGIACRIDLPINLPPWPLKAQARHNLLLAFKEVLNNILKHARATEVHVSLVLREAAFVITVQDNGPGQGGPGAETASSARVLGGNGLENVRRRLAQIGGCCEVHAVPGQGWCVVFIIEASPEVLATVHPWAANAVNKPEARTQPPPFQP